MATASKTALDNDLLLSNDQQKKQMETYYETDPLLVIHLPTLCGYDPDKEECEALGIQLEEIFNENEFSFHEKAMEMLENGAVDGLVMHADTESITKLIPSERYLIKYCVLQYPSYIDYDKKSTITLWNKLNSHRRTLKVSCVSMLLELIRCTSRDLIWKVEMYEEVLRLARD